MPHVGDSHMYTLIHSVVASVYDTWIVHTPQACSFLLRCKSLAGNSVSYDAKTWLAAAVRISLHQGYICTTTHTYPLTSAYPRQAFPMHFGMTPPSVPLTIHAHQGLAIPTEVIRSFLDLSLLFHEAMAAKYCCILTFS